MTGILFVLADGASDSKKRPSKANIETRIRNVLSVAEKGDLVLVSFSGHGMHVDGKTFLCPTGARVDSPESTMIPLMLVYEGLSKCSATRRLLRVDACRNDPRPSGSKDAGGHARDMKGFARSLEQTPEGILTLASCAVGQVSWEDAKPGHGVFVNYLLEGLSGKADAEERGNRDTRVSLLELYNYANIKTKRFVLNNGKLSLMTFCLVEKMVKSDSLTLAEAYEHVKTEVPKYMQEHFSGRNQTPQLCPNNGGDKVKLR